ncbi:MAG: zinc ribbon domain-containing protein [Candidatus Omnitrophica bacterium]|nr:zinc ribbon domain-containing protein [Candidatus Omnitrophota bacterium]
MNILWEMYQQSQISTAQQSAAHGAEKAGDAAATVLHFQDRIDKLVLINMAMWSLIKEASDLTEEDLLERIKEIDLSDGVLDGKVKQPAVRCPQCGRVMSNKHRCCLYCGFEKMGEQAFDAVT